MLRTFEACTGALFLLALDPKAFDLSGRILLPMQEVQKP